ncbi:MerR family transcriptional regulator [Actinopolymorpha sp. B11F2]|uniref:MerR family transcriptional regulator n=1 Tax=Actinopolymorpha sp. B11F2 TaxID=3160862 RepID=UPI0032E52905
MRIGELAERTGTTTRALRYYEAQGLLAARRSSNGYRDYGSADERIVTEIRSLLAIGFSLEDTRPFVECLRAGNDAGDVCPNSVAVYRRKLAELDGCIDRLQATRTRVEAQLASALRRTTGDQPCRTVPSRAPTPPPSPSPTPTSPNGFSPVTGPCSSSSGHPGALPAG